MCVCTVHYISDLPTHMLILLLLRGIFFTDLMVYFLKLSGPIFVSVSFMWVTDWNSLAYLQRSNMPLVVGHKNLKYVITQFHDVHRILLKKVFIDINSVVFFSHVTIAWMMDYGTYTVLPNTLKNKGASKRCHR